MRVLPSVCCAPQMSSAVFSERSGLLGRPERCLLSRPNYTRFSFQERSYQFRVLAWPVSGPAGGYPMYTNGTNAPLIKRPGRKDSAASGRLACRCPHRTAGTQGHAQLACSHLRLRAYCEHRQERPNAMLASLPLGRDQTILSSIGHLSLGTTVTYIKLLQLQGLLPAAAQVIALGRLHTRPFQMWVRNLRLDPTRHKHTPVRISQECMLTLQQWQSMDFLLSGVKMGQLPSRSDDGRIRVWLGRSLAPQSRTRQMATGYSRTAHQLARARTQGPISGTSTAVANTVPSTAVAGAGNTLGTSGQEGPPITTGRADWCPHPEYFQLWLWPLKGPVLS